MENAFTDFPDYRYLYLTGKHIRLLDEVVAKIENKAGLIVIEGDSGSGKTILARKLELMLQKIRFHDPLLLYIRFPLDENAFWKTIAHHLGIKVMERTSNNKNNIFLFLQNNIQELTLDVIIDIEKESDFLLYDMVKKFNDLQYMGERIVELIMFSTPSKKLDNFCARYRSCHRYTIDSLTIEEMKKMIEFRLFVSGLPLKFSEGTMEYLYNMSGGNPRKVVNLCDLGLKYLNTTGKLFVDISDIKWIGKVAGINL